MASLCTSTIIATIKKNMHLDSEHLTFEDYCFLKSLGWNKLPQILSDYRQFSCWEVFQELDLIFIARSSFNFYRDAAGQVVLLGTLYLPKERVATKRLCSLEITNEYRMWN